MGLCMHLFLIAVSKAAMSLPFISHWWELAIVPEMGLGTALCVLRKKRQFDEKWQDTNDLGWRYKHVCLCVCIYFTAYAYNCYIWCCETTLIASLLGDSDRDGLEPIFLCPLGSREFSTQAKVKSLEFCLSKGIHAGRWAANPAHLV